MASPTPSRPPWVIKIGSNVLLDRERGGVDRPVFAALVRGVARLAAAGARPVVVTSGAVALGRAARGLLGSGPPRTIPQAQALAAVGQPRLMRMYEAEFAHYGAPIAQLLLSPSDLDDRGRYLHARAALRAIGELGALPIINENDTVASDELRFGDNDRLAAMVAGLVGASALVLLTDVDGIRRVAIAADGTRRLTDRIERVGARDALLDEVAGPSLSGVGTGGMVSKIRAARIAARFGAAVAVASGKQPGTLEALWAGASRGTWIEPDRGAALSGPRVWLSAAARPAGRVACDEGARRAIAERGASLLCAGVTGVEGAFEEGGVVAIMGPDGARIGVGVATYGAEDARRLIGARGDAIEDRLGYSLGSALVHRDLLAVDRAE